MEVGEIEQKQHKKEYITLHKIKVSARFFRAKWYYIAQNQSIWTFFESLLEKYKYPYLPINHLKMGLIRSGNTKSTSI